MKNPNKLKIRTLSGDWCDKDTVMLHACFQLLTDCIEDEELLTGDIDWTFDKKHLKAKQEIEKLYDWWKGRSKSDLEEGVNDVDIDQYDVDNKMLIRLIKVRKFLWT